MPAFKFMDINESIKAEFLRDLNQTVMSVPGVTFAMVLVGNKILVKTARKRHEKRPSFSSSEDKTETISNYDLFMLIVCLCREWGVFGGRAPIRAEGVWCYVAASEVFGQRGCEQTCRTPCSVTLIAVSGAQLHAQSVHRGTVRNGASVCKVCVEKVLPHDGRE